MGVGMKCLTPRLRFRLPVGTKGTDQSQSRTPILETEVRRFGLRKREKVGRHTPGTLRRVTLSPDPPSFAEVGVVTRDGVGKEHRSHVVGERGLADKK